MAGVIGHPVRHSLSPVMQNAAFAEMGLDWAYMAFDVPVGGAPAALAAVLALGIEGLSVTMPHKEAVAAAADDLSAAASLLGAANTVVRAGDRLVGESTDGPGFLEALAADEGFDPAGESCLVLGAGGAARAVVLSLAEAGAAEVVVVNRTAERAAAAAALAGSAGRVGGPEDASGARLVVNATPLGMDGTNGAGATALATEHIRRGQLVADLVYNPPVTPLLAAAAERGARPVGGIGMLVHQAALQVRLWTGMDAPLAAMRRAAAEALAARHS